MHSFISALVVIAVRLSASLPLASAFGFNVGAEGLDTCPGTKRERRRLIFFQLHLAFHASEQSSKVGGSDLWYGGESWPPNGGVASTAGNDAKSARTSARLGFPILNA